MDIKTKEEAILFLNKLKKKLKHWKSCQDGSYELMLDRSGYFEIRDKWNIKPNELEGETR